MTFAKEKELLLKFYQMLPQDILKTAIENVQFINRTEKRKYDKYKTVNEKLKAYTEQMPLRVQLTENIYDLIKHNVNISDSEDYETILSLFSAENCINLTVYMLHRCCDDIFDKQYFSQFLQSEQFAKTLNGNWEETLVTITNNEREYQVMEKYYLGNLEKRNNYYNFEPQYLYENGQIVELTAFERETKFPTEGKINLAYDRPNDDAHNFLKKLNADDHSNISDMAYTSYYAISFDEKELKENEADYTKRIQQKLELHEILQSGEDIEKRIISLEKIRIYKVVTPQAEIESKDLTSTTILISEKYNEGDSVLLNLQDGYLYGPYVVQIRTIDEERYIKPELEKSNYILNKYLLDDKACASYEFLEKPHMKPDVPIEFAQILGAPEQEDVITDLMLLSKIQDDISLDLAKANIDEFSRKCAISPFFKEISAQFREERLERTRQLIKNVLSYQDERKDAIITLLESLGDDNDIHELLGAKIEKTQIYKSLEGENEHLRERVDSLQGDIITLENANKELQDELGKCEISKGNQESVLTPEIEERLKALENQIAEKQADLAEIQSKHAMYETYEALLSKIEELKEEDASLQNKIDVHKEDVATAKKQLEAVRDQIKDAVEKKVKEENIANVAFDPYIANVMMDAASKWKSDAETTAYRQIVEKTNSVKCSSKTREELVDMLVRGVKAFRKYEKNDIVNMYICLAQNFLTIFSGEPGTGKTSMCTIMAHSLGLNTFSQSDAGAANMNRFIPVSVERGWSSKRDLIGYFNPLTKQYDKSNGKIYDGLMVLNEERKESKFPYVMLLDEANLSSMEYYWADFMRVSDRDDEDVWINIGTESDVYIPETLKFLATINTDQTTEELSPRLIDRAWIIKLPKVELTDNQHSLNEYFTDAILWEDIKQTFCFSERTEVVLEAVLNEIYKWFERYGLSISPRVKQSIKKYICVAQELMENETGGANAKEKAVDFAILQKLMPKINGYYNHYEKMFEALNTICDENNFTMTKACIASMKDMADRNMGYCKYLM